LAYIRCFHIACFIVTLAGDIILPVTFLRWSFVIEGAKMVHEAHIVPVAVSAELHPHQPRFIDGIPDG
jgi:hypothetical protein